jgi:hypothetical protein
MLNLANTSERKYDKHGVGSSDRNADRLKEQGPKEKMSAQEYCVEGIHEACCRCREQGLHSFAMLCSDRMGDFGNWSDDVVCVARTGFGFGNTWPALSGIERSLAT